MVRIQAFRGISHVQRRPNTLESSSASFFLTTGELREGTTGINGDHFSALEDVDVNENDLSPEAPALSFRKFLTMQEKRVIVTIRCSKDASWKPYFLTVVRKVKASHPDVII